jgi:hypothetical protein
VLELESLSGDAFGDADDLVVDRVGVDHLGRATDGEGT